MKAKKKFFKDFNLAGRKYYDVDEVWDKLRVGTVLKLERDEDNKYDKDAVCVIFVDNENDNSADAERYFLGYIPADENEEISKLLDMGWGEIFECRISRINPTTHYENQIGLTVRVKRKTCI